MYKTSLTIGRGISLKMPTVSSYTGKYGFGRPAKRRGVGQGGSMLFSGTQTANLSVANDIDTRMGNSDFCIEWWQYMEAGGGAAARIFSVGTFGSANIAVSLEGNDNSKTFYFWGSSANVIATGLNLINTWHHFAVTRSANVVKIFQNGTQISGNLAISTNFNDSSNVLRIGNESTTSTIAAYKGLLTNFRWTKGDPVYTSNFPVPTAPLTALSNTRILLNATSAAAVTTDTSAVPKTITNNSITWSSADPFGGT